MHYRLDEVEMILLRADLNDAGVNITDFAMQSAQHINVGLGSASLVEECSCPPGYEGLSCQVHRYKSKNLVFNISFLHLKYNKST